MIKNLKIIFLFGIIFSRGVYAQTADVVQGCVPLKVNFTSPSASTSYFWDFKDGVTSNLPNPANIFTKPGIYQVTFQETVGGPVLKTIPIEVFPQPVISINVASGCSPLNGQFVSTSVVNPKISINNYTWVFGDGVISQGATMSSTTHQYNAKGDYNVSLGIETQYPSCNMTAVFNNAVHVYDPPAASFTTNPVSTVSCNNTLPVTFTNTSTGSQPLSYLWNLGNGQTSTAANPPAQTYNKGSYSASLTVKFASNLAGCQAVATKSIGVGRPTPAIVKQKDTICIADTARLSSTTAGIKLWTGDANTIIIGSATMDNVIMRFTSGGFHTIKLKVTTPDGQCFDESTTNIYADDVQATILHNPQYSCSSPMTVDYSVDANQSNLNYDWKFRDASTSKAATVSKTYTSATKNEYYGLNTFEAMNTLLTVTSKKTGCWVTATSIDTMWLPNARMIPNLSRGCAPLSVIFSDSSKSNDPIVKWKWLFGDGTDVANNSDAAETHVFTQPGIYANKVVVTTKRGCIDTSYAINIEVGSTISNIDFTASTNEVCPGQNVVFTPVLPSGAAALIDAYHFSTEGSRSFHCSNQQSLTWSYKNLQGPQSVALTVDYNGCFTTVTKPGFVNVKGAIAKIDYSAHCSDPFKYTFSNTNSNPATTSTWDFGDKTTGSTSYEAHLYTVTGNYKIVLTAEDKSSGCAATTDTLTVKPRGLKAVMDIDTLICLNIPYRFDATQSVDVQKRCYQGYNWKMVGTDLPQRTTSATTTYYTFTKPGIFTAQLIVTDDNGCKDTATQKIKVFDILPAFTPDDLMICNPGTVNFADKSTGDTTLVAWSWNFGDLTGSTQQNPSHQYLNKPSSSTGYKVVLLVTDKIGCKDSANVYIQQYDPTSSITASKPGLCLGEPVTYTASDFTSQGSSLKYNWNFGNSETSTQQSKVVQYTTDQVYVVSLDFEEIATGCKGNTTINMSVQTYPTASFTTNVDTVAILCAPKVVTFTDQSTSKYTPISHTWNFGNGQTTTQPNYTLVFEKGTFDVKHIVSTTNGCRDTITRTFKVYKPEGDFVTDKNAICKSEIIHFEVKDLVDVVHYAWAFGDGIVVEDEPAVDHQYNFHPPSGSTVAKLSLVGSEGCNAQIQRPITIYQVIADFDRLEGGLDTATCFNDGPYKLTNISTGASSYHWDFGDGQTSTAENVNTHTYATPGTYSVKLDVMSENLGCKDTITKEIIIYPNPDVVATGDTVCQVVGAVNLNVVSPNPTSTYLWTPSTGLASNTATSTVATIQHTVHYNVVETDINGCTDNAIAPAVIIERIKLRDLDTSIVIGDIIALPVWGESYYSFSWDPSKGLSCLTCNYPQVQPLDDILYTLTVNDARNCYPNDQYTYKISIKPETFVKMPSMFTPNGDGNNDVVKVNGWGIKELREFQIFNRWGQLIYSSNDINEGWDGTFNGLLQGSDIYVYKVKALTWREFEIKEEGYINLVR
ncbi:PKD domain-containing protein [Cytophaga hutchinsonii]|uniref:CHU large protein n=1 Tax=Cytophaga hutchinsonii (strain ATCC 33406 / DSM 1761 / CIP 103989 / NBRC 15051 / NCIMB 9469 / D465) TaxID=269798 RepID=A0A6N4STT1_CYTH3|nr:PKD domain-containing protein [Cytophaga hutchinsonii]ABG59856.1 CHU large protein [Cytophaga hutchinsonii ATCC 33406]SFX28659.1 gliding motility-associated C-terminal domain-containing protein [Cytophaga hutchinsonii ATCC 33406]